MEEQLIVARQALKQELVSRDGGRFAQQVPSVGPFRAVPVELESMRFEANPYTGMYTVNLDVPALSDLKACIIDPICVGTLSPTSRLTCPQSEQSTIRADAMGKTFAFAYPLVGVAETAGVDSLDMANPCISFLAVGGFVHFDKYGKVCALRALCQGGDLHFEGPQSFTWAALRDKLVREGRVQQVTLDPLVKLGVKGFCWLPPPRDEPDSDVEITADIEESQSRRWPHGGFLYTYDNPDLDCFFSISRIETDVVVPLSTICGKRRRMAEASASTQRAPEGIEFVCKICLDEQIEVVLLPCGHLCLCKTCARNLMNKQCPLCRQKVQRRFNVFV